MAIPVVSPVMKKMFGSRNERMVKRYQRLVEQVGSHEDEVRQLSDAELRAKTDEFRRRIQDDGAKPEDLVPEVFAVAREVMDRNVGIRNIFNPEHGFDPSTLPADAQALYNEVKQKIDQLEPAAPEGDFLGCTEPTQPWQYVDIPNRVYEAVRELYPESRPPFRARPFDVQIIGAMVLYEGRIAEMKTGEGKTIVAPLACFLAILEGKQVHVVTVNEYLVQRDRDWTFPFFRALGLTVGAIHPRHMQPHEGKQAAYRCNVVYGTTSEFGFDYLRDNMQLSTQQQVQKHRDFAIVDEVDSTLIDEARTPLIISGPAHQDNPRYELANRLALDLVGKQDEWNKADQKVQSCLVEISGLEGDIRNARDKDKVPAMKQRMEAARERLPELEAARDKYTQYYEVELDKKRATLTHDGISEAQKIAGVGSFYVGENIDLPHLLEQSIRAHTVYMRDRDYVVASDDKGEMGVVIVDQNTGRKMVGRQWSDGLHQAVEAKEGVKIKEETQTMATVTIQNFFKLYDKLAGMTGTADTEATEFYEIYKLDVVVIPTNVPVIRRDRNDLVFIGEKDKWDAIVDEIKNFHDAGRPILVGTTSVEKSEMLSDMLTRKYNIKHEVLNAKQHEREADIILRAGTLGAVMIATNMAGRGTDIKLGACEPEVLVDHWKRRGICPANIKPDMPESEIIAAVYRHMAPKELGLSKSDVQDMADDAIRLALLRKWATEHTALSEGKIGSADESTLLSVLDDTGAFLLHRLRLFENVEDVGGLHVIGTERHESRRIDNQLRGRSGRQGDNGSSRFFLSLEDDLMKMFAGKKTLTVLSKLGMKEGDAIESPMLTKVVERSQRKVEERNFLVRKNILEYDEVMDHQRHEFYGMRQDVLEGKEVKELIFEQIEDSVRDAASTYLDRMHRANVIAEWARENLSTSIDPDRLKGKDRSGLHKTLIVDAKEDAGNSIRVTMGEYLPEDIDLGTGKSVKADDTQADYQGLVNWANANYKADLTLKDVQSMTREEIILAMEKAAEKMVDEADLSALDQYLVPNYGANEMARWANNKFGTDYKPEDFLDLEDPDEAIDLMLKRAREAYEEREITYPADFAIDMTTAGMQQNPQQAIQQFCAWVKARYELPWTPQTLPSPDPNELRKLLVEEAKKWDESRIEDRAQKALTAGTSPEELDQWFRTNMGAVLTDQEKKRAEDDPKTVAEEKIASVLRAELTQFERWVLLQILDQTWKDHLYAMDQLRDYIGFRSFSQKDPRIEYKREGGKQFDEMLMSIRDKVTDLIFKAKLTPQVARRTAAPVQTGTPQPREDGAGAPAGRRPARPAEPAIAAAAAAVGARGTAAQQRDLEAASQAGSGTATATRRRPQPRKAAPTVGRNEPCPCGSGKKYKQCCGRK